MSLFADEIPRNEHRLKVINTAAVEDLVGGPLVEEALRATMVIAETANRESGVLAERFWEEPWVAELADVESRGVLRQVVERMSADVPTMRRAYHQELKERGVPKYVRRFAFNPLASTTLVRVGARFIVPQPRLIRRRMAPNALFYAGSAKYGNAFGTDLGYLAETYAGRTLRQIEGAQVFEEVRYRESRNEKASIDWFLVMPNLVVLIESEGDASRHQIARGEPRARHGAG